MSLSKTLHPLLDTDSTPNMTEIADWEIQHLFQVATLKP